MEKKGGIETNSEAHPALIGVRVNVPDVEDVPAAWISLLQPDDHVTRPPINSKKRPWLPGTCR